jgi:pentatricopeptide repeat-containing protein PET309
VRGTIHGWAWGMLERTAGCLELGSVRRFVPGSKSMKSHRMLHSAFWNHGAMELELSPLWQVLIQGTAHNDRPIETNEHDNSGGMMLDFLYPSGALNLIRQYSPWTPDRTEFRRPRGLGRIGQRLYTSAAGDGSMIMSRRAEEVGSQYEVKSMEHRVDWEVQHLKSDETGQTLAFLQSISESARMNDYEEAWRQFGQLNSDNQLALVPQLLSYLITSNRPIDADRIVSVFDTIRDQAGHSSYEALVNAHVVLRNYEDAANMHSESLATFQKPTSSDRLLGLLIQYGRWDMAFDAWKSVKDLGAASPRYGHNIWERVIYLPNLNEKVLQMVSGLTSHLSDTPDLDISQELPVDKVTFITEALSIALFPQDDFSETNFLSVFSRLERLGLATESIYQNTILKLLKMDRTKMAVRLYRKFRQTDGIPTTYILDAILKIFCKYKSNMGMHQILEDWVRHFDKPSSPAYRMVMTAFASQGNVEAVKGLWKKYLERQTYGRIRNADDLLPLMHVHAKRGEVDEVVSIFESMEDEYKVVPNIKHSNILLNAYGKAHAVDKAFEHYNKLLDSDVHPDKITIGTMMGICTQRGDAMAARELYNSAAGLGIRPNIAMVDCLVLGDIQNGNINKAEETCMKALTMALDGPKTRMWNYLLVAYAMGRDLENVSRVHRIMESSNVPPDTYTYSALMQALAVAGQPSRAWKILTEVMPEAGIQATEFHYAVVMGGFIATKELDMVFHVRDHMLSRPEGLKPAVSSNIQTLKAAVMDDSRRIQSGDADTDFAKAEDYFFQFLMNADRQELASNPRKGMGHEPLDVAYSAAYFDFYMFVCGQHKAFDRVKQLYDNFLQRLPEDRRSQPPIRILNALMVSRLKENDHDGVQEAWEFALMRAKERGKPISGNNVLLYSHRLSLCRPLSTLIKSLAAQNKLTQLKETIADIRAFGFELDSNNWNLYVQALTKAYKYQEAFGVCEKRLMPGWLGWAMIRQVEPRRNRLSLKDRARKRDPTYLRPIYHTILMLSRAYLDMEGSYSAAGQAYHVLKYVDQHCPLTLNAIQTMRRTEDELEKKILGTTQG